MSRCMKRRDPKILPLLVAVVAPGTGSSFGPIGQALWPRQCITSPRTESFRPLLPASPVGRVRGKTTFAFVLELRTACIAVGCTSSIKLPSCAMHSHLPGFGRTLPCTLPIRCATSHASPDLLEAPSLPFRSCPFTPPYHPYAPSLSSLTNRLDSQDARRQALSSISGNLCACNSLFGGRGCMNRSPRDPPSTRGIQLPERESWCEVCEVCVAEGSVQILVPVVPQGKEWGGKITRRWPFP